MDQKLKILKILSNIGDRAWKIGKSATYISTITSHASTLPQNVFDKLPISSDPSKQVSVIDFILLTYDMNKTDKEILMNTYGIDGGEVLSVLKVATDIAEEITFER